VTGSENKNYHGDTEGTDFLGEDLLLKFLIALVGIRVVAGEFIPEMFLFQKNSIFGICIYIVENTIQQF